MTWLNHVVVNSPEIFIFLAMAIGTLLGRVRVRGFTIGATACTLLVAVVLAAWDLCHPIFAQVDLLRSLRLHHWLSLRPGVFCVVESSDTCASRPGPGHGSKWTSRHSGICVHVTSRSRHDRRDWCRQSDPDIDDGHGIGCLGTVGVVRRAAETGAGEHRCHAVTYICGYILVLLFVPPRRAAPDGVNPKDDGPKTRDPRCPAVRQPSRAISSPENFKLERIGFRQPAELTVTKSRR